MRGEAASDTYLSNDAPRIDKRADNFSASVELGQAFRKQAPFRGELGKRERRA